MKRYFMQAVSGLVITVSLTCVSLQAHAQCSTAITAGKWAYTYTGTIFTPAGAVPAASVGHFNQDRAGNVSGSQSRSVAGDSGVEDVSGTVAVNKDCTATGTINVFLNCMTNRGLG